jgi:Apea-like HEPN
MRTGYLGLPLPVEPRGGQSIQFEPIPTHIYYSFARESDFGKSIKGKLLADNRLQHIIGKMLSNGSGASKFEIDHLIAWYAYRINEFGSEQANKELNFFLDSSTVDLLCVLWIYGTTSKTRIGLFNGIELTPIDAMPLSQEKIDFQLSAYSHRAHELPSPQAALTKKVTVPKVSPELSTLPENPDVSAQPTAIAQAHLHKISLLINAIPGACCMAGYQTSYTMPGTPLGPFGGSSGGSVLFDMLPRQRFEFNAKYSDLLSELFQKFDSLGSTPTRRIESALHRLAQAKGRFDHGDACLDLGIALEMVLLNTEHENQELPGQLNLHFRLRGSWLIGKTKDERRSAYKTLGKIYSLRSKIAHNGYSKELSGMPYAERQALLANHVSLAEKILQHLIMNGTPGDWADVTLGA